MQFEKIIEISMLHDFYGQLLSEKQRDIFSMYYEENLSLAEIAAELGISRQGVHDALKKSVKLLEEFEEKLGLVLKFSQTRQAVLRIDEAIDALIGENSGNDSLKIKLQEMKQIIDSLDD